MSKVVFSAGQSGLAVAFPSGETITYPWLWLRDSGPSSFHPQTEERTFSLMSVPLDIKPLRVETTDSGINVWWPDGAEPHSYPASWFEANRPSVRRADPAAIPPKLWRGGDTVFVPRHDANAILENDEALGAWLTDTAAYGLSIVENTGLGEGDGVRVAERIGFLRQTNFGTTFVVKSKKNPNNLAYTSHALPLHTDLANQEVPPGYQFLHCIVNEADGGGSTFADGFRLAEDMRLDSPEFFETLSTLDIPFRFHDQEYDIRERVPVIVLNRDRTVREIRYNAHLADILDLPIAELDRFYPAYRTFMERIHSPAYKIALKLKPGEMVVFDNRRSLHGREAFDPSTGARHLQGCYVDRGEFLSKIRVLARNRP